MCVKKWLRGEQLQWYGTLQEGNTDGGIVSNGKSQKARWIWLEEYEKSVKIPERNHIHEVNVKSGIIVGGELVDRFILQYTWWL